jgi:hypothetical protein
MSMGGRLYLIGLYLPARNSVPLNIFCSGIRHTIHCVLVKFLNQCKKKTKYLQYCNASEKLERWDGSVIVYV